MRDPAKHATPDFSVARDDFTAYKRILYPRYEHAPHLQLLDEALMQVARFVETDGKEGIQNLLVNMPPRHGKTMTAAEMFPTWFIGRNPHMRVILTSYGATLAHRSSRRARNLIRGGRYEAIFSHELAGDSSAVDSWSLSGHEGGMDAMGVLGGVTGKGAHLVIADDLLKNREEAESAIIRDKTWDAWTADFLTRLNSPYAGKILFATRWHRDDPSGRILNREGEKWHVISLPAIAEDDDILGRRAGEALWEDKYPLAFLREQEANLGIYNWSSLYQQNPVPADGGFFQRPWFRVVETPPQIVYKVRFWDLAMSDKPTADFTCGVMIGQGTDGHFYVLDVVRRRVDWGQLVNFMADVMLQDGVSVVQGVEMAGYQSRAVADLNADRRLHGYSVQGFGVDRAKHVRALPVQAKLSSGHLHLVRAHWNDAYIDEFVSFTPRGALHDDQIDATSGAWAMLDSQAVLYGVNNW